MSNAKKTDEGSSEEPSLERVSELVRENLVESPYQTLAAALGVGFFMGGGLWKPVVQALLGMGARFAIGQVASRTPRSES